MHLKARFITAGFHTSHFRPSVTLSLINLFEE